jgi:hypothetical protein
MAPVLFACLVVPGVRADSTDNPVATFYSGPEGYPAWTDGMNWSHVINMKTYAKGKTAYQKFENARDALSETGGVLYYPAGSYDFTTIPPGRGLMLRKGIVIRGEAPPSRALAGDGQLELPTKFIFPFRKRGGGEVPGDWSFIGLMTDKGKQLKDVDRVGIAWVHLVGATICFGPQLDWGKSWATAGSVWSSKVKKAWAKRRPDGTHPFDALVGGGKHFVGAGKGRLVFGCVLEDAAVLDDFLDPGYGPDGFHTQRSCARIIAYGSRVLVANNLLPRSQKNFTYSQRTRPRSARGDSLVMFDYGKTCGIDINKELLAGVRQDDRCPGYFEEGIVVRDNWVFNHGNRGYSISGTWVTITGNQNERALLRQGDEAYGRGPAWALTLDGYQVASPTSDNLARAFDLAGRNLWIDRNTFNNTGSVPGNDGEGIVCRGVGGTQLYSWAITHNTHTRGTGSRGYLGGWDVDCHGLLVGWNKTPGWIGDSVKRKNTKLNDCAFVGNECESIRPDAKTVANLRLPAPLTTNPPNAPTPSPEVSAEMYKGDAVRIAWTDAPGSSVGYRVERCIGEGSWQAIAYRPPRVQGDADNPQAWIDFTAPSGKACTYRVVAVNADDADRTVSKLTRAVTVSGLHR